MAISMTSDPLGLFVEWGGPVIAPCFGLPFSPHALSLCRGAYPPAAQQICLRSPATGTKPSGAAATFDALHKGRCGGEGFGGRWRESEGSLHHAHEGREGCEGRLHVGGESAAAPMLRLRREGGDRAPRSTSGASTVTRPSRQATWSSAPSIVASRRRTCTVAKVVSLSTSAMCATLQAASTCA